jgi:hypothetical protein
MKIKEGVLREYRIRKDLKKFRYGGFRKDYLGLPCDILSGPFTTKVYNVDEPETWVRIMFIRPNKTQATFRMLLSEIEEI